MADLAISEKAGMAMGLGAGLSLISKFASTVLFPSMEDISHVISETEKI